MPVDRPGTRRGSVSELVAKLLDKGYDRAAESTLKAIAAATNSGLIQQRLKELDAESQRLAQSGERLRPDNPILRALLADLETALRANARRMDNAAGDVQASGSDAAGKIQRQLALPGMTNAQLAKIGITWNVPDPEAVARLVAYTESSEWSVALAKYGADVLEIVNNQAIQGIAQGWNPLRTARLIRQMTENIPAYQANNLLRTLQLTSYRDSTAAHQQANLEIIDQVIRIAALDARCCLSCVAQHGDVIWEGERDVNAPIPRVNDHHSGRCTSVVQVKGRQLNIQSGEDWFNALPEERQRQQASFARSPGKYEAFRSGAVGLRDFVQPYTDPTFGPMLREASLTGALANRGTFVSAAPVTSQIATVNGYLNPDIGAPGDTPGSLHEFLTTSDGPLARQLKDIDMGLAQMDFMSDEWTVIPENVQRAARNFVVESQNIQYGRDYILSLVQQQAAANGVNVTLSQAEQLYNDAYAAQARAILAASTVGNLKLTAAQLRRLAQAADGNYLGLVYTTESSLAGSLANATRGGGGGGNYPDATARAKRREFLDRLGRLDE